MMFNKGFSNSKKYAKFRLVTGSGIRCVLVPWGLKSVKEFHLVSEKRRKEHDEGGVPSGTTQETNCLRTSRKSREEWIVREELRTGREGGEGGGTVVPTGTTS